MTTISSGATLNVSSGTESGDIVLTGGTLNILQGASASGTVLSGGAENVGGSEQVATVSSGGVLTVLSGGIAHDLTVSSGGTLSVLGTTTSTVILTSGAVENISSGGLASGSDSSSGLGTRVSGGTLNVLSGGQLQYSSDHLNGITNILAGGTAQNLKVSSGGTLNVAGSVRGNLNVFAGGDVEVSSGGIVSGSFGSANISGGAVNVQSGGTLALATVFATGVVNVSAGGVAYNYSVSSGGTVNVAGRMLGGAQVLTGATENVMSGGIVSGSSGSGTAISGTVNVLSGGELNFATMYPGGILNISAGGTGHNFAVSSGGGLNVAGTITSSTSISAGGVETVMSGGLISGASGSGTGLSGGTLNILSGGSAAFVGVSSGGVLNLQGTVLRNMTVVGGGVVNVSSGGVVSGATSSGTTISLGGALNVLSGGSAGHVKILAGGGEFVASGGTETNTNIAGGILELASGAIASNVTFSNGGSTLKLDGAVVSGLTINGFSTANWIDLAAVTYSAGTVTLTSGNILHVVEGAQTFDITLNPSENFTGKTFVANLDSTGGTVVSILGTSVGSGQTLTVSSGQTSNGLLVQSGGTVNVLSGGFAANTVISNGGVENNAGVASGTVVSSGAREVILSGGSDTFVTVHGGQEVISAGGVVDHITVSSGSTLTVLGTVSSNAVIYAGAIETVSSGGVVAGQVGSGTAISGGLVNVLKNGHIDHVTAFSGGVLNISSGANAFNIAVSSGGTLNVAGTVISNVIVSSGGVENVSSGGLITGQVYSGSGDYGTGVLGTLNVLGGGIAAFVGVSAGGALNISKGGVVHELAVSSGGVLNVAGATTSNVTIYDGSLETISSGGFASSGTNVSGGTVDVLSGGSFSEATLFTGGVLNISAGGTARNFGVSSGAAVNVAGLISGGVTIFSGGLETVSSGGLVSGSSGFGTGISGGTVNVRSGGEFDFTTIYSGGTLNISAGGTGHNISVSSGGNLNVAGTITSNTGIAAGGVETVSSGGLISGASGSGTGLSGGTLNVLAGGSAAFVGVSAGVLNLQGTLLRNAFVLSGGTINVSSGGVMTGVTGSGTTVSGGTINVLSSGAADHVTISSGGNVNVASGGLAHDMTVSSGGHLNVAGAFTSNALLLNGGVEFVSSGGNVRATTIAGGALELANGSTASGDITFTSSGGVLRIDGATMPSNIISGFIIGDTIDLAAATFASGGTVSLLSGGTILHVVENSVSYDLHLAGTVASSSRFSLTQDSSSGVLITQHTDVAPVVSASNVTGTHNQVSALASSLFSVTDADGDAITTYGFWDNENNGHWTISGVAQAGNTEIDVAAANLANVSYTFGSAADTVFVRAFDGSAWSAWQQFTITPGADNPPVVTVTSATVTATHGQTSVSASSLFTATDPDSDTITQYAFWDNQGNGHWNIGATAQTANHEIDVAAANLSQVSYTFGAASDTLFVRAFDGTVWSSWQQITANPFANHAPVVTVTSPTITQAHGQTSVTASGLFSVTDADSDTITQYDFWDNQGNGHWTIGATIGVTNGDNIVAAANLGTVSYTFGAASDTLYVRAFDGTAWSSWQQITANLFANHAPVVTVTSPTVTAAHGQTTVAASSMFSVADADSDTITQYDFWDNQGNGHWTIGAATGVTNGDNIVAAANLGTVNYTFGAASDTLYVRAYDGTAWSSWQQITANPAVNHAPVVTVNSPLISGVHNQSTLASNLFSTFDPDGDAITQYAFWDNQGNGHWTVNGVNQITNAEIDVSAANLSQVSYKFGNASDVLYVRAYDGAAWSAWQQISATPLPNHAPVVTVPVSNVVATHGQTSVAASGLFSVSDMDGDSITQYGLWDTQGNGHWTVNGAAQATNAEVDISSLDLSNTNYTFGAAADTLMIRAYDGITWGAWQSFSATPFPNHAPVVAASNVTATHGQASALGSSLFSVTDADSDTITQYAFWDNQGNGHWTINGATQATNAEIDVTAANLSQVSYTFGNAADTLFVRAFDGTTWGAWQSFTASPGPNSAPVVTASNLTTVTGQTFTASSLFSVTDANSDAIVKYAFWDTQGNGHWSVNGAAQATNAEIDVNTANLSQVTYVGGSGTDQLWVRANDGIAWGGWQQFTVNATSPAVVASGATLELGSAYAGAVTFASTTGTLKLDNSTSFSGTVAGMTGTDTIDFADINFGTIQTPGFTGDSTSGTLTVSDGTHTANVTLLGNYMSSTFNTSSDGHGGTLVVDPPANNNNLLAQSQHA